MSIQSELDRIIGLVADSHEKVKEKGGTTTSPYLLADLPGAIESIPEAVPYEPVLQTKTVTPTTAKQTVTPDSGYDGLSKVTVNAIPDTYIQPSGTLDVTENGTHDVTEYASVNVNVAGSGGGASIETCAVTLKGCENFFVSGMIPSGFGRFAAPATVGFSEKTITCEKACIVITDFNQWILTDTSIIASGNVTVSDIGYGGAGVIIDLTNADDEVTIEFIG